VFAHTKVLEQGHLSLGRLNASTNDALQIVRSRCSEGGGRERGKEGWKGMYG
jgi:hypothetical protein